MGAQAPQWLLTSFVDAMQQIGATATDTDLEHEGADLMQRWSAPNRQLHNLRPLRSSSAAFRRTSPRPAVSSTRIVASPASASLTRSWHASTNSSPS